jgi:hypothetical protein
MGFEAAALRGGLDAWREIGAPVTRRADEVAASS